MKWTLGQILLFWSAFIVATSAHAGGHFTYTGRILDSAGNPVTANSVRFTLTIYDPTGKCWLYTEQRELDLSASSGSFAMDIGSNDSSLVAATALFNGSVTGPQNMTDVFDNSKSFSGLGGANGCAGTYTPNSSEPNAGRLLTVFFTVDGGPNQALPVLKITPVPSALQAYAVNGFGSGELLKIKATDVAASSIPNNPLTQVQYEEFWRLVKNPVAAYLPLTGDVSVVSGNNKLTTLLGQALPAGPATNGQVLVSNGTAWTLQSMSSGSVTSVGGTAPITIGGTASAPNVGIQQATTSADGYLSSADWNTFNLKMSGTLADGSVWIGNSSGGAQPRAVSGDAAISNIGTLTLSSVVVAGTTGAAGYVPVITYDAKGRITSVTSAAVNDSTKLPLNGGTMSGALNMGGQDITNAGNISMAASKYFTLSTNAVNGTAAGQMWFDGANIKFFDGTSAQTLGVAGAGITNFNGSTQASQSLMTPGTSGNAPNWSTNTGAGQHTLNIPLASAAGTVTAGLISNAEYVALNAKQSSALASGEVWVGNASGAAQARALSGDVTIDNVGSMSLAAIKGKTVDATAASTMGQVLFFDSVADKWKVSAATAPTDGQVLKWNNTTKTWEPGTDTGGWTAVDATYAQKGIVQFQTDAATSGINVASGVANVVRTSTGTSSTILSLDGSGVANTYGVGLKGSTSGSLALQSAATTANYALTFPAAAPAAGQSLQSDASGNLTWANAITTATGIVKDGNSFGSSLVIGTNDNNDFAFESNGVTAMTIKPNGNIGIGTADPLYKLFIEDTNANVLDKRMIATRATSQTTVDGSYISMGSDFRATDAVATGATNSGLVRGLWIGSQRNTQLGVDDDGTLATLEGAVLQYGHFAVNTGANPKTTNVYGIKMDANYRRGTITNLYDLYIGAGTGGTGTITNHYSIYQASSTAKNYLNGSVGIGALTPATKLDVSGVTRTTGLDVNATYGGNQVSLRAPGAFTSYTLTLPTGVGTNGQFLQTNGSGVLTWAAAAGDATKLPLAGGTMSGNIDMGGQDIMSADVISASNYYSGWGNINALAYSLGSGSGFFLPASDTLAVVTGTTERMRFDSSGNVAIGVTTPNAKLGVSGVTRTTGLDINSTYTGSQVSIRAPGAFTSFTLTLPTTAGSANQVLQTNGSGALSWAALSDSSKLPLAGGTMTGDINMNSHDLINLYLGAGRFFLGNASNGADTVLMSGDATMSSTGVVTVTKTTTGAANRIVSTDGSGVVDTYGYGVKGTTSGTVDLLATATTANYSLRLPAAQGAANQVMQNDGSGNLSWITPVTTSTGIVKDGNSFGAHLIIGTNDNYDFRFEANGATAMTIEPSGEVGIGTTTPGYQLDIASTDGDALRLNTYSATAAQGSTLMLHRARGTAAVPTAVASNDTLGGVYARGYGATSFGSSSTAYLEFSATQAFTDANRGTHMAFFTTSTNTSTPAERMRISHDGNVGIGSNSPGNPLVVKSTTPQVSIENGVTSYNFYNDGTKFHVRNAATVRMSIDASGNVGIGTSSPSVGLVVEKDNGNGYAGWFRKSNTSDGVGIGATASGGVAMIQGLTSAGAFTDLTLNPVGGSVGVGIAPNGASSLQVSGAPVNGSLFTVENVLKPDVTANGTYYNIGNENNITKRIAAGVTDSGYLLGMRSNTMRNFIMGGSDNGTLASIGGVVVQYGHYNTNAAATPQTTTAIGMQVVPHNMTGNITTMYDIMISPGSTGGTTGTHFGLYAAGANKLNFFDGKLGIGTNGPDQMLVVYNGSTYGRYTTSGWTHSSDVRLKTDIQPLNDSLSKILQLDGVSYRFKSDSEGKKQIGFIAQEVEPVFPEVVTTDKDGMKSMIYGNLVAPLVESVKALYAKIMTHDEKLKTLEAENQAMKEALCELGKQQFCSQKRVPASN